MSANSLLNGSTPSVIPNVPSTNPLYNPSIPVMGDQSVRSLRNINISYYYNLTDSNYILKSNLTKEQRKYLFKFEDSNSFL